MIWRALLVVMQEDFALEEEGVAPLGRMRPAMVAAIVEDREQSLASKLCFIPRSFSTSSANASANTASGSEFEAANAENSPLLLGFLR